MEPITREGTVDALRRSLETTGTPELAATQDQAPVMGNTAEQVLRQIRCSVLTPKPEGFMSPVAPRAVATAGASRPSPSRLIAQTCAPVEQVAGDSTRPPPDTTRCFCRRDSSHFIDETSG